MVIRITYEEGSHLAKVKIARINEEYDCTKYLNFDVPISILPSHILCELMTEKKVNRMHLDCVTMIFDHFYDKVKLTKSYIEEVCNKRRKELEKSEKE